MLLESIDLEARTSIVSLTGQAFARKSHRQDSNLRDAALQAAA
jgi:hypothetical protein